MNFDNFTNVASSHEHDLEMSRTFPTLMRKVYVWMAMALAITGVVAYGAGNSPALIQMLYMSRGPLLIAGLAELPASTACHSSVRQCGSSSSPPSTD